MVLLAANQIFRRRTKIRQAGVQTVKKSWQKYLSAHDVLDKVGCCGTADESRQNSALLYRCACKLIFDAAPCALLCAPDPESLLGAVAQLAVVGALAATICAAASALPGRFSAPDLQQTPTDLRSAAHNRSRA